MLCSVTESFMAFDWECCGFTGSWMLGWALIAASTCSVCTWNCVSMEQAHISRVMALFTIPHVECQWQERNWEKIYTANNCWHSANDMVSIYTDDAPLVHSNGKRAQMHPMVVSESIFHSCTFNLGCLVQGGESDYNYSWSHNVITIVIIILIIIIIIISIRLYNSTRNYWTNWMHEASLK